MNLSNDIGKILSFIIEPFLSRSIKFWKVHLFGLLGETLVSDDLPQSRCLGLIVCALLLVQEFDQRWDDDDSGNLVRKLHEDSAKHTCEMLSFRGDTLMTIGEWFDQYFEGIDIYLILILNLEAASQACQQLR